MTAASSLTRRSESFGGAPAATILVRILVGATFLSEGIQKFLFPEDLGAGRFASIGIWAPEITGPAVGAVEILCGGLLLAGYFTRAATMPLIVIMLGALITTKLPILLGHDVGPFVVRSLDSYGFWSAAHEARTDVAMFLGSVFLLIVGPGPISFDSMRGRRLSKSPPRP